MTTSNKSLDGIVLTDVIRSMQENVLVNNIGVNMYKDYKKFFDDVIDTKAAYKVFMSRRCLHLMYNIHRTNYNQPIPENYYSDFSILDCTSEMAEHYATYSCFPSILIVEDILVYGRSIKKLVKKLSSSIYQYLKDNEYTTDSAIDIYHSLIKAIEIYCFSTTTKPTQLDDLLGRLHIYQQDELTYPKVYSSNLYIANKLSLFGDSKYTLSVHASDKNFRHIISETTLSQAGFRKFNYNDYFRQTYWIKAIQNNNDDTVAYYIIRITHTHVDERYVVTPFILISSFNINAINNKLKEILGDACNSSLVSESIIMTLSHNLLLLLLNNKEMPSSKSYDVDKLTMLFNSPKTRDLPKKLANMKTPFMDWYDMTSLIVSATTDSPDCYLMRENNSSMTANYQTVMEDIIYEEANAMERDTYNEYSKRIHSPVFRTLYVKNLFQGVLSQSASPNYSEELAYCFMQIMDLSSISIDYADNIFNYTYYAGELAQFIMPIRYYAYMSSLINLERACLADINLLLYKIDTNFTTINEELKSFVRNLYNAGQKCIDFDINFLYYLKCKIDNEDLANYDDVIAKNMLFVIDAIQENENKIMT